MTKKVSFRVVDASGWDEGYSTKELETHSPLMKGWRSPRYCPYPQEIVIKLSTFSKIKALQLLSHQYLISSRVEVFIGSSRSGRSPVVANAAFKRLGYIAFSSNQQNGYRSRELKSIPLDVSCQFVKLVFYENHVNYLNVFNQVGLVALNVVGEPLRGTSGGQEPEEREPTSNEGMPSVHVHSLRPGYHSNVQTTRSVPPLEDLTFAVYQDKETAKVIQHLQLRKEEAVQKEKFDQAKILKQAIVDLRKVGEVLGHFEVEKKQAVDREDYELAKAKKLQSDNLRLHVYQQLNVCGLVQDPSLLGQHWHTLKPIEKPPIQSRLSSGRESRGGEVSHTATPPPVKEGDWQTQMSRASPRPVDEHREIPRSPVVTASKYYDDDRPLPALLNKSKQPSEDMPSSNTTSDGGGPEPLSEKVASELALSIQVFGTELVQCVHAKQFKHREEAIGNVRAALKSCDPQVTSKRDIINFFKAAGEILKKLLNDKVTSDQQTRVVGCWEFSAHTLIVVLPWQVFTEACVVLKFLLSSFWDRCSSILSTSDVGSVLAKTIPALVGRLGDNMPRIVQLTIDTLTGLVQMSTLNTHQSLCDPILEPFGKQLSKWKLVQGRLNALLSIVRASGCSVLNVDSILNLALPCFDHSNGQVRDTALELVVELYKLSPRAVKRRVPSDTPTKKKLIWRTFNEEMDKIDGKPLKKQQKNVEQAKIEEIAEMQKEVSRLRDLAVKSGKIPQEPLSQDLTSEKKQSTLSPSHHSLKKGVRFKASASSTRTIRSRVSLDTVDSGGGEKMCIFCEVEDDNFTEATLNKHYIEDCPMLYQCPHCSQVVEIPALQQHYLTECDAKGRFKKCPRCKEAILTSQYHGHVTAKSCKVPGGGVRKCPLCGVRVHDNEQSWRKHILEGKGCKKNPRPLQT